MLSQNTPLNLSIVYLPKRNNLAERRRLVEIWFGGVNRLVSLKVMIGVSTLMSSVQS